MIFTVGWAERKKKTGSCTPPASFLLLVKLAGIILL
jgi:hypothetical protein